MNDYNDKCIRRACIWYKNHCKEAKFVFLTDDAANRNLAIKEKITAVSGINHYRTLET